REYGLPRIRDLQNARAAVRFLSIEPLLEDVGKLDLAGISWAIVGGESGPEPGLSRRNGCCLCETNAAAPRFLSSSSNGVEFTNPSPVEN
ncbi:MAG: DUF5131 family protein, partial [Candidatus Acidiferrales bacterium]